jgi:hypothetical protein
MMKIALLDAKKTQSVLKRLISDHDEIQIAVAWGYNGKLADLLMENSRKFRSVTFGLNGFATSPDLVQRLIGTKNAFIAKRTRASSIPSSTCSEPKTKQRPLLEARISRKAGLDQNHEVCLHIKGSSEDEIFDQIQCELSGYDALRQPATQMLADSYRRQFDAASKRRGQRSDPPRRQERWKRDHLVLGDDELGRVRSHDED